MKPQLTIHGTMMSVFGWGVLITGKPGVGKSMLAAALLDRGHQLISDDATDFYVENQSLIARCPPAIQNQLWLNGHGLVRVTDRWGPSAIKTKQRLDLIIHLGYIWCFGQRRIYYERIRRPAERIFF